MNANLKNALIEKIGTSEVFVDCEVMCNSHDYKIGNKYVTTWHVDVCGKREYIKRVEITKELAQELANAIKNHEFWDAMRSYKICKIIDHYHIKLGLFR